MDIYLGPSSQMTWRLLPLGTNHTLYHLILIFPISKQNPNIQQFPFTHHTHFTHYTHQNLHTLTQPNQEIKKGVKKRLETESVCD